MQTTGTRPLRDVTTEQINALYLRLLTKGKSVRAIEAEPRGQVRPPRPLAAATVQKTHVALSLALGYAVKLGWLDSNPTEKAVRPQSDTEDRPITSPATGEVLALLAEGERSSPNGPRTFASRRRSGLAEARLPGFAGPPSTSSSPSSHWPPSSAWDPKGPSCETGPRPSEE